MERDFLEAIDEVPSPVDLVWIGLSHHHLRGPDKLAFMRKIPSILKPRGRLMIYENTSTDGDDRRAGLDRRDLQRPNWHAYTDDEWTRMSRHVHAADFPETLSTWRALGRDAGFHTATDLYSTPTDLIRL